MVQRSFWGNLIRELRVKKKLSQRRLARSHRGSREPVSDGKNTTQIVRRVTPLGS